MNLLKKLWDKYLKFNNRARKSMRATRSIQTSFRCPKCKSLLFQIIYAHSYDPQYFCKKCGYEGAARL